MVGIKFACNFRRILLFFLSVILFFGTESYNALFLSGSRQYGSVFYVKALQYFEKSIFTEGTGAYKPIFVLFYEIYECGDESKVFIVSTSA